jgi:hypothetical protein
MLESAKDIQQQTSSALREKWEFSHSFNPKLQPPTETVMQGDVGSNIVPDVEKKLKKIKSTFSGLCDFGKGTAKASDLIENSKVTKDFKNSNLPLISNNLPPINIQWPSYIEAQKKLEDHHNEIESKLRNHRHGNSAKKIDLQKQQVLGMNYLQPRVINVFPSKIASECKVFPKIISKFEIKNEEISDRSISSRTLFEHVDKPDLHVMYFPPVNPTSVIHNCNQGILSRYRESAQRENNQEVNTNIHLPLHIEQLSNDLSESLRRDHMILNSITIRKTLSTDLAVVQSETRSSELKTQHCSSEEFVTESSEDSIRRSLDRGMSEMDARRPFKTFRLLSIPDKFLALIDLFHSNRPSFWQVRIILTKGRSHCETV